MNWILHLIARNLSVKKQTFPRLIENTKKLVKKMLFLNEQLKILLPGQLLSCITDAVQFAKEKKNSSTKYVPKRKILKKL